jgi:hypothetical protein
METVEGLVEERGEDVRTALSFAPARDSRIRIPAASPRVRPARLPEKGRQYPGSTAESALKEAKVIRQRGSVPPTIIARAEPLRIKSLPRPTAVAPEEQAVMIVALGP